MPLERRDTMDRKYTLLFNAITDAINELQDLQQKLMTAQQEAERIYMERTD